jgi:hypothetical protein
MIVHLTLLISHYSPDVPQKEGLNVTALAMPMSEPLLRSRELG